MIIHQLCMRTCVFLQSGLQFLMEWSQTDQQKKKERKPKERSLNSI